MKKKLFIFLSLSLIFIPFTAFAVVTDPAGLLSGSPGLVPKCEGAECRACDLVELANNVINFGVAFSVIVATLMFAYAGLLYVTAGSAGTEQVKKAHSVFVNIFVGLIAVLLAWLLVNIFFSVLTGKDLNVWTQIRCERNPVSAAFPAAPTLNTGSQPIVAGGDTTPVAATNPLDKLENVHPDLVRLVNAAHSCSTIPFIVTSGFRTRSATASDSRHLQGMAVDAHPIINGRYATDCSDGGCRAVPNEHFRAINAAFECGSQQTGVPFEWGGSSPTFMQGRYYDAEHFQLPRSVYPNG